MIGKDCCVIRSETHARTLGFRTKEFVMCLFSHVVLSPVLIFTCSLCAF